MVREIQGLKCPSHDYLRDYHHFLYDEVYRGAKPFPSTICKRCGFSMSLHKVQKY